MVKRIKQHLRIKRFYGNTENAVRSQRCSDLAQYVWIAVSVYVLVAIVKKRLSLDASLNRPTGSNWTLSWSIFMILTAILHKAAFMFDPCLRGTSWHF